MARPFINAKKIQNGTRKLALLLSDSTFITAYKVKQATKAAFGSNDTKQRHEFVAQLASLLDSDSPTVRLAVVEALNRISREKTQTVGYIKSKLQSAASDNDPAVKQAAKSALNQK